MIVSGALKAMKWLLLLTVTSTLRSIDAATYPLGPNRFLGTCLDSTWVAKMEAEKGVSSKDRDSSGRLVHPFLQPALKYPRYRVDDPRTSSGAAYTDSCVPEGQFFYGAGQDAEGTTRGDVNGTLVLDLCDWETHALSTMVLAIIAQEVSGYTVSINKGGLGVDITQRMSSVMTGVCNPTHLNIEVWTSSTMPGLRLYFNESYNVGGVGYFGLSGVYTTHKFVKDATSATPPYYPDFWKDYKTSDALISALSVKSFKANSNYFPPAKDFCPTGTNGCEDNCQRTEACTKRENAGGDCLVMALMKPGFDRGFFQSVFDNLDIPAYFCFIGYGGLNKYASDAAVSGAPVLFYHYEPDPFHVVHKGQFDRVFLPRSDPERVKLSTGDYGENGFGVKTSNPLDVDYPSLLLSKFAANIVKDQPIGSLFSKLVLSDSDINDLLSRYITASSDAEEPEPYFRAACNWVKENYDVWSEWLDRLPLCTFEEHILSQVTGCDNDSSVREIEFSWKAPNPGNTVLPNDCDGGVDALPATITTSRSCDWIYENRRTWSGWIDKKPVCDSSFYDYNVSECDSDAYRTVQYFWKFSDPSNIQDSGECSGGDSLPETIQIDCEYMPTSSPTFAGLATLASIVTGFLAVAIVVVFKQRNAPIIRRSQFEMLLLMIFGGFFTTGAAVAYAGRPTYFLCGIRPVLVCMGFTTIFGSLVIKSLRVYRVFMRSAMKRVKVTLFRILKILSIFYVGDIIIFIAWYAADFPEPTITTKEASEFRGTVDRISCSSSSFIFTALLIFWKAILLMLGLYLSFLIRNVSVDFQESPWIFGSVVVVLVGCLVIMPMSYLVEMRASTYFVFLACALLFCTILIMCLMLVPKAFRLNEAGASSSSAKSMVSIKGRQSLPNTNMTNLTENDNTVDGSGRPSQIKYQVKPLHKTSNSEAN
ncbi:Gamma-aminobutyric acid type B receptor subunit 2 [Phytophthora ramorum]|uniref:Gamma-aminobutyric acid type B receptor subunit 2 n=1 Tax=Phytophthora ramorum TaxID=164328 RepID=UPI0030AFC0A9|nr:Gamma-aminobutyric acid type B receptor subunit 2 [Phytophthora ramorum]